MSKQLFTKRFYISGVSGAANTPEEKLAEFVNKNSLGPQDIQIRDGMVKNGRPCLVLLYWAEKELN